MVEPLSNSQKQLRNKKLAAMTDLELLDWIDACEKMERSGAVKSIRAWSRFGRNAREELAHRRMTEAEYFGFHEPGPMLEFLKGKVSERKLRLFACACCRRIQHLFVDERSLNAVRVGELYADDLTDRFELVAARNAARDAQRQLNFLPDDVRSRAAGAAQDVTRDTGMSAASNCYCETSRAMNSEDTNHCNPAELRQQTLIVECLFGNPFKQTPIDFSWLRGKDDVVVELARRIYSEPAFDQLPDLADALESVGCAEIEILDHCRKPGPHFRGCWVVDFLLGLN